MIHPLRQLAMFLVVTLIAMGVTVSAGSVAMDLECGMMQSVASADAHAGHSAQINDHVRDEPTAPEGHGSSCKTHACPATACLASSDEVAAVLIGRTIDIVRPTALVELTVPDGLRRPPRA